jgi:hypothetical protein
MTNLKEKVDIFLKDNYKKIEELRDSKLLRWLDLATEFAIKDGLKKHSTSDGKLTLDPEYLRNRYSKLRKKKPLEELTQTVSTLSKAVKFVYTSGKEDKKAGTKEFTFSASHIPTEEEIISHFNIDTTKYKINQIYHKTSFGGKYAITVSQLALKGNLTLDIDQKFLDKINNLKPLSIVTKENKNSKKPKASLLIPKQDAHWNKLDINGNNCIDERFASFTRVLTTQLRNVEATNTLEKITYIIGSDEFNAEWTDQTTKGTPQQNILSYQESFEKIAEFNIETIKLLSYYAPNIEVVLLNGNHDHNVGWHLINLIKQVFKGSKNININDSLDNTKLISFHSTLVLLNHGDAIRPKDLAAKFPLIAKDVWSYYDNFVVVCGDKHHEMSHDFNGTLFFQVPQLSTAKSNWDDKKGYITSKAELLIFLFEEDGLSNILRKQIK